MTPINELPRLVVWLYSLHVRVVNIFVVYLIFKLYDIHVCYICK